MYYVFMCEAIITRVMIKPLGEKTTHFFFFFKVIYI
jgi:hypothetical protein